MKITLPVSGTELEIPSFSYAQGIEFDELESTILGFPEHDKNGFLAMKAWAKQRNEKLLPIIEGKVQNFANLPYRDANLLLNITYRYNMGDPVAAIKNLLDGGDGAETASETTIAPIV